MAKRGVVGILYFTLAHALQTHRLTIPEKKLTGVIFLTNEIGFLRGENVCLHKFDVTKCFLFPLKTIHTTLNIYNFRMKTKHLGEFFI